MRAGSARHRSPPAAPPAAARASPQGEPAGGDHLRQVDRVLGPEFGRGAPGARSPPGSSSTKPTRRARASQNEGESGKGTNASAIGPASTGSSVDPVAVALVEHPLLGLPQRFGTDPLPEGRQAEDRLEPVRLADLADRAAARGKRSRGRAVRDARGDRRMDAQERPEPARPTRAIAGEFVDRAELVFGIDREQAQLEQRYDRRQRVGPQDSQRMRRSPPGKGSPRSARRGSAPGATQSRSRASECLDGRRLVEMFGDLVGDCRWAGSGSAAGSGTLCQADRGQACPFVTAQGGSETRGGVRQTRAVALRRSGHLSGRGLVGDCDAWDISVSPSDARRGACDPSAAARRSRAPPPRPDQKHRVGKPAHHPARQCLPSQQLFGEQRLGGTHQGDVLVQLDGNPSERSSSGSRARG